MLAVWRENGQFSEILIEIIYLRCPVVMYFAPVDLFCDMGAKRVVARTVLYPDTKIMTLHHPHMHTQ